MRQDPGIFGPEILLVFFMMVMCLGLIFFVFPCSIPPLFYDLNLVRL